MRDKVIEIMKTKRREIHWMLWIPGWLYASDVYADSEREARAWYRERYGYNRLPKGTQVWRKVAP